MSSFEYNGQEKLFGGNGSGLEIQHTGFACFKSKLSDKTLILKNLSHMPDITKNLLSVSKFALDNDVFFEFHPLVCYVKDQVTKVVILTRTLHIGLYTFDSDQFRAVSTPPVSSQSVSSLSHQKHACVVTSGTSSLESNVSTCSHCNNSLVSVFELKHNRLGHP